MQRRFPPQAGEAQSDTVEGQGVTGEFAGRGSASPAASSQLPSITLPKGGGAIRGIGEKTNVTAVYGSCSVSVPLPFSASRSGFGPQLGLAYDSSAGNGCFGFGWSLNLPAITRKSDKGLPRYADGEESDVYILSGAEDLVPLLDSGGDRVNSQRTVFGVVYEVFAYRPRIESAFARIERWCEVDSGRSFWRTMSRDNVTSLYGYDAASSIADPAAPTHIYAWHISRSWDDRGNLVVYAYAPEDSVGIAASAHESNRTVPIRAAQSYLKSILYGNVQPYWADWTSAQDQPLPSTWLFQTVFDFGDHAAQPPAPVSDAAWLVRPDPFSTYRPGFELRTYRRVQRVLFFNNFPDEPTAGADRLVRSLELTYSDQQAPFDSRSAEYTMLAQVSHMGYGATGATRALPPLALTYSEPVIQSAVLTLDPDSFANLPEGLDGSRNRWIDLDGEGLSGVLVPQEDGWYYKRNQSANNLQLQQDSSYAVRARFGPLERVTALPTASALGARGATLMDLSGGGMLDVVELEGAVPGYFKRTADGSWEPFQSFASLPEVDCADPNLKFIDVTGDGLADILITEDGLFTFYPSLGEDGFDVAQLVRTPWDEEKGPRVVLADGTQTIFVADMSGDGLNDIVRVRNGETCYWPNIGYGRFGPKVIMDGAPRFDSDDQFDPTRIRLADVDGTGTMDILYAGSEGVRLWFNQSGNSWSAANVIAVFPSVDELSSVQVIDLLGTGTACLVWSSPLPAEAGLPLRYVDLMGGQKPHLLINVANNMGAETRITYAPSSRFYRQDADAGTPWVTRLPFPVQVIERMETLDWIGRNRMVSRYAYHHGYFDGYEREFRGFGCVEQWDTEEFRDDTSFPGGEFVNWNAQSWAPPVRTVSWFHTGAFLNAQAVTRQFASEYWQEPALIAAGIANGMSLADTILPSGLDAYEMQEAYRALKGRSLRVEVYAEDGSDDAPNPYTVTEQNFTLSLLQPRGANRHAAFRVDARESVTLAYERNASDPRVSHEVTLSCDQYGNPLRSISIGYARRSGYTAPEPSLSAATQTALAYDQQRLHIRATGQVYTNAIDDPVNQPDNYRTPLPSATGIAEMTGVAPQADIAGVTNLFAFVELDGLWQSLWNGQNDVPYEQVPAADVDAAGQPATMPTRRLLSQSQTVYRSNDLTLMLPAGTVESMALPGLSYRAALTPGLLAGVFGTLVTPEMLASCGYLQLPGDAGWWVPSGQAFYSAGDNDTPAMELAQAQAHFFLPRRAVDPFGGISRVDYDAYDLLAISATDPVQNVITSVNDYRLLSPAMVTDANGNQGAVLCDALGMVTATAVMAKTTETLGDSLAGVIADLDAAEVAAQIANPLADPATLIGSATTRLIYDLDAYARSAGTDAPMPSAVYTLARETHISDLAAGQITSFQYALSYSDGMGRVIQAKKLAAPGPLAEGGAVTSPRWVGSGWTILNNKGKPVRRYEPFFSATSGFEFDAQTGVSSVLFYDSAGRSIGTLRPDATWSKVTISAWMQQSWDGNDTVLTDPATDPVIGNYFARLPEAAGWTSWHDRRINQTYGDSPEQQAAEYDAAKKTEAHSGTFSVVHFDSLARTCLAVIDNGGIGERYPARTAMDTEGKPLVVFDTLGRRTEAFCLGGVVAGAYISGIDMAGQALYSINADAGARRMLTDVAGGTSWMWDARGHVFRLVYDAARRKTQRYVSTNGATEQLLDLIVYGEGMAPANLCGRVFRQYDGAGFLENTTYDYKGNLLVGARQLAADYHAPTDWTPLADLTEAGSLDSAAAAAGLVPSDDGSRDYFISISTYDALNRPIQTVTPHNSSMQPNVMQPGFDAGGQLTTLDVWLQQAEVPGALLDPTTADAHSITAIDTNARGQRIRVAFGNGTETVYDYDPNTYRMVQLTTSRPASFAVDQQTVQDLLYFYDPVGNITRIRDDADTQNVVFFANQRVEPSNDYTYDPLYRLVIAQGREHLGQTGGVPSAPQQVTNDDSFRMALPQPGDGNAMGTYTESYVYDHAGNIASMLHQANSGSWALGYNYAEASWIATGELGNRLSATTLPGDSATGQFSAKYTYDAHGNMTTMPHLQQMVWDADDRLLSTTRQAVNGGTPATTYYEYNSGSERVRKATDMAAAAGVTAVRKNERVYLGAVEVYREFASDGTVSLMRETLHVAAGAQAVAMIETRTAGSDPAPQQQVRYQHGNHLGSAALELDDAANIVSYEEYYPYGSTSYQAVASQTDLPKRYRFTGKERDEENDLNYHGARYYAPWLGRWTSCDPKGMSDGPNLYEYAHSSPSRFMDPTGNEGEDSLPKVAQGSAIPSQGGGYVLGFPADAPDPEPEQKPVDNGTEDIYIRGEKKSNQSQKSSSSQFPDHLAPAREALQLTLTPYGYATPGSLQSVRLPVGTLHLWSGSAKEEAVQAITSQGSGWMMGNISSSPLTEKIMTVEHANAEIAFKNLIASRPNGQLTQPEMDAIWGRPSASVVGRGAFAGYPVEGHGETSTTFGGRGYVQGAFENPARIVGGGIAGGLAFGSGMYSATHANQYSQPAAGIGVATLGVGEATSGIIYGSGAYLGSTAAMTAGTFGMRALGGAGLALGSAAQLSGDIERKDTNMAVADSAGVIGGGLMVAAALGPAGWGFAALVGLGFGLLSLEGHIGRWAGVW